MMHAAHAIMCSYSYPATCVIESFSSNVEKSGSMENCRQANENIAGLIPVGGIHIDGPATPMSKVLRHCNLRQICCFRQIL